MPSVNSAQTLSWRYFYSKKVAIFTLCDVYFDNSPCALPQLLTWGHLHKRLLRRWLKSKHKKQGSKLSFEILSQDSWNFIEASTYLLTPPPQLSIICHFVCLFLEDCY